MAGSAAVASARARSAVATSACMSPVIMCVTEASRNIAAARRGIAGADALGLGHEQLVGHEGRAAAHLHVAGHALDVGREQRVDGQPRRLAEQRERAVGLAGARRVGRRLEQPPRARLVLGGELGGAAEVARRGGVRAAPAGVEGGGLERRGDRLVGRHRAGGQVPRALRAALGRRGGQGGVRRAALGGARGVVGGRAQQRMAEVDLGVLDRDEPRGLGRRQVAERRGRARAARARSRRRARCGRSRRRAGRGAPDPRARRARAGRRARRRCPGRSGSSSGSRPARWPSESWRGISSSASGLPAAVFTRRSATDGASRSGCAEPSSARASSSASGDTGRRSSHGTSTPDTAVPSRSEPIIAMPSAPSRRPAKRNASSDGSSSHCASSMATSTGCSSAATASRLSRPAGTVKRSCGVAGPSASAPRSARACTSGTSSSRSSSGVTSSPRPAKGMSDSVSIPRARSTRMPVAWPIAQRISAVLPIPASPCSRSAPLRPARGVLEQPVDPCPFSFASYEHRRSLSAPSHPVKPRRLAGQGGGSEGIRRQVGGQAERCAASRRARRPRAPRAASRRRGAWPAARRPGRARAGRARTKHSGRPSSRARKSWRGVESSRSSPRTTSPMPWAASSTTTARL